MEQAPYVKRLQGQLDRVAARGLKFEVRGLDPPDHSFHPLTEFRCAAQVIRNAIEAERQGYEAFVLGRFQEPGLLEVKSVREPACDLRQGAAAVDRRVSGDAYLIRFFIAATAEPGLVRTGTPGSR